MIIGSSASPYASIAALNRATTDVAKATERISTTLRINRAADDPGGLMIANRLKAQISSMVKAVDNVNAGIALQQRVDGALSGIGSMLQQMRAQATSAASGTLSAADRSASQLALASYRDEINAMSRSTTWNGASVLDGSAAWMDVQGGVQAGDMTRMQLFSTLSSALGKGDSLAVTASGTYAAAGALATMTAGDLTINGVSISATQAADDSLSYTIGKSGSAIAKAAAINRSTATTNVEAKVGTTTVAGTAMSTATSGTHTITLNDNAISITQSASDTLDVNRTAVVAAINANAGLTGVQATDTGDSTRGVVLTAADGRNIVIGYSADISAATSGLGAAGTYSGTYTLRSLDGAAIRLGSLVGKDIGNAGLAAGSYAANLAQLSSTARAGSMLAPSTLAAWDLMLNGYGIGGAYTSDDTASPVTTTSSTRASSAIALAAAINRQSTLTKVSASANPNVLTGSSFTAASVSSIFLNGTTISVNFSASTSLNEVVNAINPYAGQTGVSAASNGSGITLTAGDGRNIAIGISDGANTADGASLGLGGLSLTGTKATTGNAMTFISSVKLSSDAAFTLSPGANGATVLASLGLRAGTYGASADDTKLAAIDISTQQGASNALSVIDKAIDMVSAYQARVGAQQSRLENRVDYLSEMNISTSAAYGNVMNADLAAETANLAAAKIRVDGSTAMLAQASQINQQMVSYLLKQFI